MASNDETLVYIISTYFDTYYTGITNNLIRRWKEHKGGKSSYLRRRKPKEVIYLKWYATRKEAHKNEQYIKTIGASKFIMLIKFEELKHPKI